MKKNIEVCYGIIKSVIKGLMECENDVKVREMYENELKCMEEEWGMYEETGDIGCLVTWVEYLTGTGVALYKLMRQEYNMEVSDFESIIEFMDDPDHIKYADDMGDMDDTDDIDYTQEFEYITDEIE